MKWPRAIITSLFIVSGLTSLVYETLWIRVLSLGIGSTSASMSMVLSIFFFGLALGSFLSGRFSDQIKDPLRTYGLIEGSIGLYSFALIYVLLKFPMIMSWVPVSGSLSWLAFTIKFFLVFLFLIFPTVLMGATLPLLVKILSQKKFGVGKNVSWLYTVNTVGAVLGAFTTGYYFIPKMGVLWTNHLMVLLNLAILVVCYAAPLRSTEKVEELPANSDSSATEGNTTSPSDLKKILWVCAFIGFASIGSEVIWNKYLAIFFGSNIFGLSLILSIFLFGIALGSFLLSRIVDRIRNKPKFLTFLVVLTLVSIVGASQLLNFSPIMANIAGYYFPELSFLFIKSTLAFLILVIPTCIFGALLPLLINLITTSNQMAPRATGLAYSTNTVGGILGSACAGLWLIPQLGSEWTLKILCLVLVLALALCFYLETSIRRKTAAIGLTLMTLLVLFGPSIQFKNIIKSATYSWPDPNLPFQDVMAFFSKDYESIQFLHEGKTAIISLNNEMDNGQPLEEQFRLKTNGLNESYYDMTNLSTPPKFEALLGLLPYIFVEKPQNAFIVGYGGGYTVDVLTSFDIPEVYVAELESGILRAADHIYKNENPILKRQNLNLQIEDARFVLNAKRSGPYDIIVSQPSHSWLSGVANLFTLEFFETVKDNLATGGIYSQWLNLYNIDEESLKSILHTFFTVFPHGAVFTDHGEGELIMLGSAQPLEIKLEKLYAMTEDSQWREKFSTVPFETPFDVMTHFMMSREKALSISENSPLNTDINAYAEVRQSSVFYSSNSQQETVQPFLGENFDGDYKSIIANYMASEMDFLENLIFSMGREKKYEKYLSLLKVYEKKAETDESKFQRLAQICYDVERLACAKTFGFKSFEKSKNTENLNFVLTLLNDLKQFEESEQIFLKNSHLANRRSECLLFSAHLSLGKRDKARHQLNKIRKDYSNYTADCDQGLVRSIAEYELLNENTEASIRELQSFLDLFPNDLPAISLMLQAYLKSGEFSSASTQANYFTDNLSYETDRLEVLAKHYRRMGWHDDAKVLEEKIRRYKN